MEALKTYTNFIVINKAQNCYLCPNELLCSLDDLRWSELFSTERGARAGLTKAKNYYKKLIQSNEKHIADIKNGTEEFFNTKALARFEEDLELYNNKLSILEASEIREVSVNIKFNIK